ncbi:PREDICTED: complex III assembly factor LYRM7 [Eufriesea mexicana]|uniref:complex III assembly factor LYRM7 n=1 Tax=Eufriesea mexicana TaxID=516756 RepID=UPI00083C6DE2|nr:PREDICTED: complex III assembly factor LYRM7 [Eufriesea mexicana]
MGDNLRRKVLQTFRKLHRTRMSVFVGDEHALEVTRNRINEEYRKYKNVTNAAAIEELNKFAEEVEHEMRTTIIQAVEKEPGKYELRIRPDTLIDNVPYIDNNKQCSRNNEKNVDLDPTSKDKEK